MGIIVISITMEIVDNNVTFSLNGEKSYTISVNKKFEDVGYSDFVFNKNINDKVKTSTNLDISKVGIYYIKYSLNFFKSNYNLERIIEVVDEEGPIIKLNGDSEVSLYVGEDYIEQGIVTLDNYNCDIISDILISGNVNDETRYWGKN